MRRLLPLKLALASLAFAACVTINVYFPAASAEKAADQIIDTVTNVGNAAGSGGTAAPQTPPPASPPQSYVERESRSLFASAAGRVIELMIPAAQAQSNANIDISSPEIRAITASMQARFEQMRPYFASGAIGLTTDGLVELRDQASVALAERAVAKRLVAEDNRDRNTLYAEIAKANGHPEWEADIRKIFARRWVERGAQTGWYYQDAGGAWKQK